MYTQEFCIKIGATYYDVTFKGTGSSGGGCNITTSLQDGSFCFHDAEGYNPLVSLWSSHEYMAESDETAKNAMEENFAKQYVIDQLEQHILWCYDDMENGED